MSDPDQDPQTGSKPKQWSEDPSRSDTKSDSKDIGTLRRPI